jgi:hypothetical protein
MDKLSTDIDPSMVGETRRDEAPDAVSFTDRTRSTIPFESWSPIMDRRWLLLVATLFAGCSQPSPVGREYEQPLKTDTNFAHLTLVLAGIPKSGDISLHEGLPSEFWEPELREQELNRAKTIAIHGHRFYEEPLTVQGKDADPFTALFSSRKSLQRYNANKRCGGYAPDYMVEWKAGEAVTQVLISLECGEVKMFGPKGELHCDLSPEAQQRLGPLLRPYQKNRPSSKSTS